MKRTAAVKKANKKRVDERGSLEKFVGGVRRVIMRSCKREKSSMLFWRSRMLRKKSRESSFTGFTVGAGAIGGPLTLYWKELEELEFEEVTVGGGAGCRAMKAGIRRARRSRASGRTERRYGSRQIKE